MSGGSTPRSMATHVVREAELAQAVEALAQKLAVGPTESYGATRTLLKVWVPNTRRKFDNGNQ